MNSHVKMSDIHTTDLSRRSFLVGTAAAGLALGYSGVAGIDTALAACTVHVNGEAVRSCQTSISDVAGKKITTIEGLSAKGDHPLQKAWIAEQVPQCGYCQSGQIMQAASLLSKNTNPTKDEIVAHMDGNLCRCMTYSRITKAIMRAASEMRTASVAGERRAT
jgi:isoquinoline 1-oxidoreductase alpha subunit